MPTLSNYENSQRVDPVCNMMVSNNAEYAFKYDGKEFSFCSSHCLYKFKDQPEQYLNGRTLTSDNQQLEMVDYTCPMHPEIRQKGPGNCPKCGMALEPVTFSAEEKNEELIDMSRRFWVCSACFAGVFPGHDC